MTARRVPFVPGAVYDAGRGGSPTLQWYILRRRQNGDVVRDFGPAATITSLDRWHEDAARDGHQLASVPVAGRSSYYTPQLFQQCVDCGVISIAGHPHTCPGLPTYDPRAWT